MLEVGPCQQGEAALHGNVLNVFLAPGVEVDLAKLKVPPGRHEFHLESTVKGKYHYPPLNGKKSAKMRDVTYRLFTMPIVLEIAPAPTPKTEKK